MAEILEEVLFSRTSRPDKADRDPLREFLRKQFVKRELEARISGDSLRDDLTRLTANAVLVALNGSRSL